MDKQIHLKFNIKNFFEVRWILKKMWQLHTYTKCFLVTLINLINNWHYPLSIWTGFFQFSSMKYWVWRTGFFFPVWNQLDIFSSSNLIVFSSFWARVKYFEGPCLTIYSLSTIYRDIHYQFLVWWIHYSHCCESKRWKPGKISSLFTLIWHF